MTSATDLIKCFYVETLHIFDFIKRGTHGSYFSNYSWAESYCNRYLRLQPSTLNWTQLNWRSPPTCGHSHFEVSGLQCDVLYLERWVHRVNGRCFNYTIACFFPKQYSLSSTNLCTVSKYELFIISLLFKTLTKIALSITAKRLKINYKKILWSAFFLSQD